MVTGLNQDLSDDSKSQLCVPDDNLEDLDFFPNFSDDLIQLVATDEQECFNTLDEDLWKAFETLPEPPQNSCKRKRQEIAPCEQETKKVSSKPRTCLSFSVERRRCSHCLSFSVERRRCSHCDAEKTPQWREGPNGPKSLCNACGVRYKSGRLVPEYRPAASPSFDSRKHSNFHRKIIQKKVKVWQDDEGEVLNS